MNNNFGFQPNLESMASYLKENERTSDSGDSITWWSIPTGMSSIRILPPWDPSGRIALPVYSHPIEFQGKGMKYKKYSWTCVNRTFGKPCNICEGLAKIASSGVDVSSYEPSRRTFYMNAIVMYDPLYDRDLKLGKKPENCEGVAPGTHVLMRAPKTIYDWVVANITNPMVGDITSVTNGIDVFITKEGTGLGTTYTATLSPDGRKPIPQEILDKIEKLYDLDEVFSTGFEAEQINELVDSLSRSSGAFQAGIPSAANQMAGYQTPQNVGYNNQFNPNQGSNVQPPMMSAPSQTYQNPPSFGQAPNPFPNNLGGVPWEDNKAKPQMPNPVPVAPSVPSSSGQPDCFGRYTPSSVQCVTCAHEVACQKTSGK